MLERSNLEKTFFDKYPDSLRKTSLDLADKGITDQDIPIILSILEWHQEIEKLDVSVNEITDIGLIQLATKAKLKFLNVQDNPIGDEGFKSLSISANIQGYALGDFKTVSSKMSVLTSIFITPAVQPIERIISAKKAGVTIDNEHTLFAFNSSLLNQEKLPIVPKPGKNLLRKSN